LKECKTFVIRFMMIVIFMILVNIVGFDLFQKNVILKIIKEKNEMNLKKNLNILEKYIEEKKEDIFKNSKFKINNIEKMTEKEMHTQESITKNIFAENSIDIKYYFEIFDKAGNIVANSPGYIEKIEFFKKAFDVIRKKESSYCEIIATENNIYIKSVFPFGNNGEYIAVVSYKLKEDFFDRVKEYLIGDVNVYNKEKSIILTTVKGEKQEKIKRKSIEIKNYDGNNLLTYSNAERSGILKSNGNVLYEIVMPFYNEKKEMKRYFYYIVIFEVGFFILMIIILLSFMKKITGTEREFWKKIRQCMLGNDYIEKKSENNSIDYNIAFYSAKEIFIKNIYESIKCIEKKDDIKEKIHKLKDLTEIYNMCFGNIKEYKIEDVEIVTMMKQISEVCSKYNIIVDIRKNRNKMYSTFERHSIEYIFISVIYKLSEMNNSIKINVTVEDYGRKIFIRFKSEETGITIEDQRCLNSMFNKEFIDYLIMANNMGYAEKNGVVEISLNT
jgi:hypothetical protein